MAYNANIQYVHQSESSQVTYGAPFARPGHATGSSSKKHRRFSQVLLWMGCSEIVLGVLQCVLCVASLIVADEIRSEGATQVSPGIWCGVFLIVCGVFGVFGGKYPTFAFYGVNIAMCVMAAIFMVILVVLSAVFAIVEGQVDRTLEGLHISLAILGFIGLVSSIVHSAFTCAGCCCVNSATDAAPAQPVTYASHYIHPVSLPYSNAPGYPRAIPPQPQHIISGPMDFRKQEMDAHLSPPPYSP